MKGEVFARVTGSKAVDWLVLRVCHVHTNQKFLFIMRQDQKCPAIFRFFSNKQYTDRSPLAVSTIRLLPFGGVTMIRAVLTKHSRLFVLALSLRQVFVSSVVVVLVFIFILVVNDWIEWGQVIVVVFVICIVFCVHKGVSTAQVSR